MTTTNTEPVNTGPISSAPIDEARLEAFVGQAVTDMGAAISGLMLHIGDRLGLYQAMAGAGPITAAELAARTGTGERYVREWLGNQAAGGYVVYHPADGTFELPAEQAMVVAREDSPVFLAGAFEVIASCYADHGRFVDAFRTGAGIGWQEHDDRLFSGVHRLFRSGYAAHLVSEWLRVSRGASQARTMSSLDRPWRSPRPSAAAIAGATMAGSVTGTRSTYQAPSAYRLATPVTRLSASRVLPTPPGPTAVTRRCAASAPASAARSAARPTNEVSGDGGGRPAAARDPGSARTPEAPGRSAAAAAASARRSLTWSLRSSEDTWLSTVRTEMNSRAAISALVRCSPSAASTSASRAETPAPEATAPAPTLRFCPNARAARPART
jgi:hypothetical protein